MALQNPFANLGSAFEAQKQQSQLAQLLSEEQFKRLQALSDPQNNLALARASASAQGNYPSFDPTVQASGIGEGLIKGVAKGIAHVPEQLAYNRQRREIGLAQQYAQQAQAQQRELVMNQITAQQQQAQAAQQHLSQTNPQLASLYVYMSPEGRQSLLSGIGTREIGLQYAPKEAVAKEIGNQQVRQAQAQELGQVPLEVGGIPQPNALNQYQNIYGRAPITSVDVEKGLLGNTSQRLQNAEQANKLSVQPQQLQQDIAKGALGITGATLDNQIKSVEAQFADQEARLNVKRDQLANDRNSLSYKKSIDEYKQYEKGKSLFQALQESGELASSDPIKQAQIQAQLGLLGVKYNPPSSGFTTIKNKSGAIYLLDKATGKVGKLERDGQVKQWQTLKP